MGFILTFLICLIHNVNSNLGIVISYQNGISLACLVRNVNSNLGIVISFQNGIS